MSQIIPASSSDSYLDPNDEFSDGVLLDDQYYLQSFELDEEAVGDGATAYAAVASSSDAYQTAVMYRLDNILAANLLMMCCILVIAFQTIRKR